MITLEVLHQTLAELGDFDMEYPHQEDYDGEFSDVPPWGGDGKFLQAPSSMEDPSQQVAEREIPGVPEGGPHQEVLEDPNQKVSSGEFPDVPLEDQTQEASDGESAEENKSTEIELFGEQIAEGADVGEVPVAQSSPTTGSMEDNENELPEVKEKRLKALRTAVV